MEVWKPIAGYGGMYEVSNYGRVISYKRGKGKLLRPIVTHGKWNGYLCVSLYDKTNKTSRKVKIHRLVAEAFIPNDKHLPLVNHKDENKRNNRVDNLEWCSMSYNVKYAGASQRASETKRLKMRARAKKFEARQIQKVLPTNGN